MRDVEASGSLSSRLVIERAVNRRIGLFVVLATVMALLSMHGASGSVHGSALHAGHEVAHQADHETPAGDTPLESRVLVGCASAACAVALAGLGTHNSSVDPPRHTVGTSVNDRLRTWLRAPEPPVPRSGSVVS
jgi:hypothetical protein